MYIKCYSHSVFILLSIMTVDLYVAFSLHTHSVITEDTPVTAVQNILKATTLADDSLRVS